LNLIDVFSFFATTIAINTEKLSFLKFVKCVGGENVQVMEVNNKKEGETNDDEDSVYNKIIVYIDFNEEAAVNSHFERSFI